MFQFHPLHSLLNFNQKFQVKRFMVDVMTAVETDKAHSEQLADVLAEADMRGHYSHGLNRLGMASPQNIMLILLNLFLSFFFLTP